MVTFKDVYIALGMFISVVSPFVAIYLAIQFKNIHEPTDKEIKTNAKKVGLVFAALFLLFVLILEFTLSIYRNMAIPFFRRDYIWQKDLDGLLENSLGKLNSILLHFLWPMLIVIIIMYAVDLCFLFIRKKGLFSIYLRSYITYILVECSLVYLFSEDIGTAIRFVIFLVSVALFIYYSAYEITARWLRKLKKSSSS